MISNHIVRTPGTAHIDHDFKPRKGDIQEHATEVCRWLDENRRLSQLVAVAQSQDQNTLEFVSVIYYENVTR